jgi:hypothetical protein
MGFSHERQNASAQDAEQSAAGDCVAIVEKNGCPPVSSLDSKLGTRPLGTPAAC